MVKTRLMERLFSAVEEGDEKLTNMVGEDINTAVKEGKVEDDLNGLSYEHKGDGVVAITDKETGEVTMAGRDPEGEEDEFELWVPDEQIEGFVHPEGDGVTPGPQEGAPDEHVEDHIEGGSIADQPEPAPVVVKAEGEEEVCPECGKNPCECEHEEEKEEEEKEFSITTDNTAVQKIFSLRQELVETLFSEVVESEETSIVGQLKFEKVPETDSVVVTDMESGDQAKVSLNDDEMRVSELESKNFDEAPRENVGFFVVGLDPDNHQFVESQEASAEAAQIAMKRFEENGCIGVNAFEDVEEAAEYMGELMGHLQAEVKEEDEVEEKEFSDGSVYYTRNFTTSHNDLMYRMFSESIACEGECPDEDIIRDAIEGGEKVEAGEDVIIPLRDDLALIHDTKNDEYTKVVLDDDKNLLYESISAEEADKIRADVAEKEGEEKEFSNVYCNEAETRFFSLKEPMTEYMIRLFSEEADEEEIVEAIEKGEQIEKDKEIITPIDEKTAIIEDKENEEFTKAVISDEEVELHPISEEEADELTKDLEVSEEEKEFSEKVYTNEASTKYFSESENLTEFMVRLFSDEADEEEIVDAIEKGEKVEKEAEVIIPVDEKTAIIEDKENGEFTKATLEGEDKEVVNVEAISEEEAKEMIKEEEAPKAEEEPKEEGEEEPKEEEHEEEKHEEEEEKEFSTLDKFFCNVAPAADGSIKKEITLLPGQSVVILDENGNPVEEPKAEEEAPSVEAIEDKALAAIQAIQEASAAAEQAIMEAKAAPAETQEAQLQEAQFSEEENAEGEQKEFSEKTEDTLLTWLSGSIIG